MVKLLYPLLSLASGIFAEILTTTVASSAVTATSCKTTLGSIYRKTVPTGTHTRSLGPEVDVVLAVSTRVKKVTPPAVTATQTAQVYTTTTTTAATVTGTFSTTTTLYETESETVTHTAISTLYSTEVVTSTSFVIEPTPSGWISVEKSAKIKNRQNGANFNFEQAELQHSGLQQPLHDDEQPSRMLDDHGLPDRRDPWPPGHRHPPPPRHPGQRNPFSDNYPSSVDCVEYRRIRYVKMIIFVKPYYRTTTVPAATSTVTSTEIITSTSTLVPDSVTATESFSITSITMTTLISSITETTSTTEYVTGSTTITSYAACFTENVVGPNLDNGNVLYYAGLKQELTQEVVSADTAYDCCVSCLLSSQNCVAMGYLESQNLCARVLDPSVCRGQTFPVGALYYQTSSTDWGIAVSNGPCGQFPEA